MSKRATHINVLLFSLAAFLCVLALLGSQLARSTTHAAPRTATVIRKIYQTTVLERVIGARPAGTSSSSSVSQSGAVSAGYVPALATKTS